jgi:glycerol-3-phosphate dehydrogenase
VGAVVDRETLLKRLQGGELFDLLVIGGGATGCGVALDAATRGLKVALVEKGDFGSGSSSRSSKLLHGGVRYLERAVLHLDRVQFNLVREGLHERAVLLKIAPHLCHPLPLIVPLYHYLALPYYFLGLKLYDLLAGSEGIGRSRLLRRKELLALAPSLRRDGVKGGVLYYDGQFNDARMNLALALTAVEQGAAAANYVEVTALVRERGRVAGATVRERFGGESWEIRARCVINACGPLSDGVRRLDDPQAAPLLQVSSGAHLALPSGFLPGEAGITIPKTEDGRVLFVLPWLGGCLVGTTDRPALPSDHPAVGEGEIDYLLRHLRRYFEEERLPEIRSAWAGLRPLLRGAGETPTAHLAREHSVTRSPSGLVTIAGGKWTSYRRMAKDAVDYAIAAAGLAPANPCRTDSIPLCGGEAFRPEAAVELAGRYSLGDATARHLHRCYGDRAAAVAGLCQGEWGEPLLPGHPYLKGELLWGVRREFVLTCADFLMRRIPMALLDRNAASQALPLVLDLLAKEFGWDRRRVAEERRRALEGVG